MIFKKCFFVLGHGSRKTSSPHARPCPQLLPGTLFPSTWLLHPPLRAVVRDVLWTSTRPWKHRTLSFQTPKGCPSFTCSRCGWSNSGAYRMHEACTHPADRISSPYVARARSFGGRSTTICKSYMMSYNITCSPGASHIR